MSPLSAARAALRVYAAGAAVILAQLLRRCRGGFLEPGRGGGAPGSGTGGGAGGGRGLRGACAPGTSPPRASRPRRLFCALPALARPGLALPSPRVCPPRLSRVGLQPSRPRATAPRPTLTPPGHGRGPGGSHAPRPTPQAALPAACGRPVTARPRQAPEGRRGRPRDLDPHPPQGFPRQPDRVAIVTGGTDGIGYSTAKHLARLGMHVIIAGNNDSKAKQVVSKIKEETLNEKVEFLYCDLASMMSIREFVQKFKMKKIPLHVLINNGESW
nr:translation initiation factor IF-2 [Chlorocebus sabaeus]